MIALVLTLGLGPAPQRLSAPATITITTPRGETRLPVVTIAGAPMVAAAPAVTALGGRLSIDDDWAEVTIATLDWQFLLGAPFLIRGGDQGTILPLAAPAVARQDTILLPLEFLASILPRTMSERYAWDPVDGRFVERGPPVAVRPPPPQRLPNGLLPGHVVTIDPGHGGVDPGSKGVYLPRGIWEKNVTLGVGTFLREELTRRGITVKMTRTTDTLINLADRGPMCTDACDLFVSLHVNSLKARRNYTLTRGFETYFLSEAKTEDAAATARMENEAIRYEVQLPDTNRGNDPLGFALRDLMVNEHLRESARLAALMQDHLASVHSGTDRGVNQANFAVLRTARRPAVLVEMGFSTNREDGRILGSRAGQRALATAIADAVVEYLKELERKTGQSGTGAASR